MRRRVFLKVGEAIKILESMGSTSEFFKELKKHPKDDWVIEGDEPDENGNPKLYVFENNPTTNKILMQHESVDLNLKKNI